MMLDELTILCKTLPAESTMADYKKAVIDDNVLGKPTFSSRQKTFTHLKSLYGLDTKLALFRVLRKLTETDVSPLPILAMICAYCRDPQLRQSFELVDSLRLGEILLRAKMETHFAVASPGRFSKSMKESLSRNVNTSWTVSGHLTGKMAKKRSFPKPQFTATVYAMFAGYLLGLRGEILINSVFARLVAQDSATIQSHLATGAARGWLRYRSAGGIMEIDFNPLLTQQEQELLHGTN
jgi:hypothetical protein